MKNLKNLKHEKEFDTKTLLSGINESVEKDNIEKNITKSDSCENKETKEAVTLKELAESRAQNAEDKETLIYEPRPLTPDDDIYEEIIEQFASAPTKPKYWFEEFGDYWSCSCGHINKGNRCMNCGLERDLLRSLFILHKPAGAKGKLGLKLKTAKQKADEEEKKHTDRENRRRQLEEASGGSLQILPIENISSDDTPDDITQDNATLDDVLHNKIIPNKTSSVQDSGNSVSDTANNTKAEENSKSKNSLSVIEPKLPASRLKFSSKKIKVSIIILVCMILAAAAGAVIYTQLAIPAMDYNDAKELQAEGKYEEAIAKYKSLGDYEDSEKLILECYISMADKMFNEGQYTEALETYEIASELGAGEEIQQKIRNCHIAIGDNYFENGQYNKALSSYGTAKKISSDDELQNKIRNCYISIGDNYYKKQKYKKALSSYETAKKISSDEDLQDKINAAKFGYVSANISEENATALKYMEQLMDIMYPGIQEIYDEYYAWHVNIIANTSENDFSTALDTASRKDTVYFHVLLSGGEPSEEIRLYYEITWPNGASQVYNLDSVWKDGSKITAAFRYPIPRFGKEGKLTFKLYEQNTLELMGSDSIILEK